jgi:hypothetical protein
MCIWMCWNGCMSWFLVKWMTVSVLQDHTVWDYSWEILNSAIVCQSIPNSSHLCLSTCRWTVWWYRSPVIYCAQSRGGHHNTTQHITSHHITSHSPVAGWQDYFCLTKCVVRWNKAHYRQFQAKGTLGILRRNGQTDGRNARKRIVIQSINCVAFFSPILSEGARVFPSSQRAQTILQRMSFLLITLFFYI